MCIRDRLVSILKAVRERRGKSGKVTEAAAGDYAAPPPGRGEPAMPKGVKVYPSSPAPAVTVREEKEDQLAINIKSPKAGKYRLCLLYTSDAADDLLCVDLGGRRIIKKKKTTTN